ncbi:MAG: DUF1640 domain-containing protein [Rickettsiales bacterium]|jgi:hypothetical protein|nr:MAG: DUF1640 domain-containing protein [Rickettsiales bacterium]
MALINTHATVKKFIQHGFTEEQAEVIVETINNQNNELVTKQDLDIAITKLDSKIESVNTNIKWIMAIGLLIVGILLKNTFIH